MNTNNKTRVSLTETQLRDMIKESVRLALRENHDYENSFINDFDSCYEDLVKCNELAYKLYCEYVDIVDNSMGDALEELYNKTMEVRGLANTIGQRLGVVGY